MALIGVSSGFASAAGFLMCTVRLVIKAESCIKTTPGCKAKKSSFQLSL